MIKSFNQIVILQQKLVELKSIGKIKKFKITKQLNHQTTIHLYDSSNDIDISIFDDINNKEGYPSIDIRYIDNEDYNEDKQYWDSFFLTQKNGFEGTTRRLDNAFGKYEPQKNEKLPPIIGFYSYKGGVGRSTTLAAFASYHARKIGDKVLIIDCDFEAPGFSNFYGMDEQDLSSKSGVVEYLVDSSYLQDRNKLNLDNYIHTISASAAKDAIGYAGSKGGAIYVMKAGNLSVQIIEGNENAPNGLKTHQDHYLQGLARIDFANSDYITKQFTEMLLHICNSNDFKPDLILIDSRTGFNDIFNNIVLRLSDAIVGFFGTSRQNIPGIYEFLDTISVIEHSPEVVLANSLCADVADSYLDFKEIITHYTQNTGNDMLNLAVYSIEYNAKMSKIGTPRDKGDDMLIYSDPDRYRFPDYQNGSNGEPFLEYISNKVLEKKKNDINIEVKQNSIIPINIQPVKKEEILNPLLDFFQNENYSHAEGRIEMATDTFLDNYFYFRNYLKDIFRKEIFIVRGYKGTGKTLIYNALQNEKFIKKLQKFYNEPNKYSFLGIVQYNKYPQLKVNDYLPQNLGLPAAIYYKRFWVIYVWNEILSRTNYNYTSIISCFNITNEDTTRVAIENLMKNDTYLLIEKDLRNIDSILKDKEEKLVISFDYLDDIIPLDTWGSANNAIAILMDWCRTIPYDSIYPKIFIRTDLYDKVHGINNNQGLKSKILPLDWEQDEIFAYFFKIVYAKAKNEFINYLFLKNEQKASYVLEIKTIYEENNGQISLENKEILKFLVKNFFGENVSDKNPYYGKSYTWFYENLKNANKVISLRPFIALIENAIEEAKQVHGFMNDINQPILRGQFFASNTSRIYAAEQHFKDIFKEKDNQLKIFMETMRSDNRELDIYRKMSLDENKLKGLINKIYTINNIRNTKLDQWKELLSKLDEAGIIRRNESYNPTYSFAFLYKFYFRLEGNPARRG